MTRRSNRDGIGPLHRSVGRADGQIIVSEGHFANPHSSVVTLNPPMALVANDLRPHLTVRRSYRTTEIRPDSLGTASLRRAGMTADGAWLPNRPSGIAQV